MSRLPISWIECQLGEILKIRNGYAFRSTDFTKEGVPLVRQANLAGNTVDLSNCVYLPNHYLEEYQRFCLGVGDILIGMSGSIGKLCIYDKPYRALQNQRVGKVDWISIESVHVRYIWHFLKTIEDALVEKGKGVAVANVSAYDIESMPFPLAPLKEQKRIAEKLDAVLARVDACREHLDRVPAMLKRFRQAALTDATSGKLTEEWRASDEVEAWRTAKLSEVAKSRLGKMLDKAKNQGAATPYLRNINVRWFGFDLSDIPTIRVTEDEARDLAVEKGDVLICEGGEPGRCAVWQGENGAYVYQKALHRVRVGPALTPEWLCYSLKDAADSGRLTDLFTGTTIKHLTGVALGQFEVPLPPLREQREITRLVEALFAYADRLEARYTAARAQVEHLTPVLLAKAFRGELVPQDPNDEPASVLLERIHAARAAAGEKPPRKGRIERKPMTTTLTTR